ncbi:cytochrome c [Azospirillum sp. SYSU D00513]|uniref:c-type cytochrome n=1 Tax=Azospirillum sp. SYSU D00513 TaxID=2812561 RepID=UPI001A973752|nr:cytochrome c [Azospirillum sp. SYSU D00513]
MLHMRSARTAATAVLFTCLGLCSAYAADPAAQIKERQQTMKALADGMKPVAAFAKNEGPLDAAKAGAVNLAKAAATPVAEVFPQGTAIGVGDSHTKPGLWENWGKSQELWSSMKTNADALVKATEGGDRAQVVQAMQAVGKTCGGCHEDFRQKKQ